MLYYQPRSMQNNTRDVEAKTEDLKSGYQNQKKSRQMFKLGDFSS